MKLHPKVFLNHLGILEEEIEKIPTNARDGSVIRLFVAHAKKSFGRSKSALEIEF